MTGPIGLAVTLGVITVVAGATALVRLVLAWHTGRPTDMEIDAHNIVMGVAMTGMLVPSLLIVSPGLSTTAWLAGWILITCWFAVGVLRDAARIRLDRRFAGHHIPHLVMAGAMVFMLSTTASDVAGSPAGMPGSGHGIAATAVLAYVFVVFFAGFAVVVVDRLPVIALVGIGRLRTLRRRHVATSAAPVAPRLAAATDVAMAITMGYALTLMA